MASATQARGSPPAISAPSSLPQTFSKNIMQSQVSDSNAQESDNISQQIEELEAENAELARNVQIQAAILLNQSATQASIAELPQHSPRRKPLDAAVETATLVLQENLYRMLAGITAFPVRDPDPNALDGGHLLGVRIDVCSDGRFKTPYFVFLQRAWPARRVFVKLAWHTIPPGIPVEALAERYLPAPKWPQGPRGPWVRECCEQATGRPQMTPARQATLLRLAAAKKDVARQRTAELKRAAASRKKALLRGAGLSSKVASRPAAPKQGGVRPSQTQVGGGGGGMTARTAATKSKEGDDHECGPEVPQDLGHFLRELRGALTSYNNRLSWVADMMEAAGVNGDWESNRFLTPGMEGGESDSDSLYGFQEEADEEQAGSDDDLGNSTVLSITSPTGPNTDLDREDGPSAASSTDKPVKVTPQTSKRAVATIHIMDSEAKWLQLEWADGRTGELTMDDDGVVTKLAVIKGGMTDWKTVRRLLRHREPGTMRIELFNRHLARMTDEDMRSESKRANERRKRKS